MTEADLQREIHRRQRVETLQSSQQRILRLAATGRSLGRVLSALVDAVEELFPPSLCAVLVYHERDDCLSIGAAQSIDPEVRLLLDNAPLAPHLNSFSAAAYRRETVIVTDIATDETCGETRAAALRAGYRSCWAHPVLSPDDRLLGVIGMYHREARGPSDEELAFIADLCDLAAVAIGHDAAERRMRTLSSAVEQTDDAVMIMDRQGAVEYVNPAFERITGRDRDEVLGERLELVNAEFHEPGFHSELWDRIRRGQVFRDVFVDRRRDGQLYYEEKTITPLKDEQGEIRYFVATGKDITTHMKTQQRLHYLAHHDALTGLANRALLFDHLDNALAQAQRSDQMVALLYVDLDRFKSINDGFGHSTGDRVLRAVAERLRSSVREADTVARLGGDEFVVVLPSTTHVEEPAHVAQNLIDALRPPLPIDGNQELFPSVSIGIAVYPIDGEDAQTLLRNADLAMYRAKTRGGGIYEFYAQYMTAQTTRHLEMERALRGAQERGEFSLHYQPRIDAESGSTCAIEALLRWRQPELGEVAPTEFVPVLEETGLMIGIGRWVILSACRYLHSLHTAGLTGLRVAVNLSPRQFGDSGLIRFTEQCLRESDLEGRHLELEITESLLNDGAAAALPILKELQAMGIRLAIDGFGSSHFSLASLNRAPVDSVTIDRTFVAGLMGSADQQAVVTALIAVARTLGYGVTAEGVETAEQLALLRDQGCSALQGFYFSRPLSAVHLEEWISQR